MKVIYAIKTKNGYKFIAKRHDDTIPARSKELGRVDDIDVHLMLEWCYEEFRKGRTIDQIKRGF